MVAQFIGSAENAIVRARNRVHKRKIVANDRVTQIKLRHDRDLAAMRFKIEIVNELP